MSTDGLPTTGRWGDNWGPESANRFQAINCRFFEYKKTWFCGWFLLVSDYLSIRVIVPYAIFIFKIVFFLPQKLQGIVYDLLVGRLRRIQNFLRSTCGKTLFDFSCKRSLWRVNYKIEARKFCRILKIHSNWPMKGQQWYLLLVRTTDELIFI